MSRRRTKLEKEPFLGQLSPTHFLPWGHLPILRMGVDLTWASRLHRGKEKPQRLWPSRGAGMTEEKPQRPGWFSPWDVGWALEKLIRGLNKPGAKSGTDLPASQASFVLSFFSGAHGAQRILSTSSLWHLYSSAPNPSRFSATGSFSETLAPPAVREQLCKDLEPALSIFCPDNHSPKNQGFNLDDHFQSLRFCLTGLPWVLTI